MKFTTTIFAILLLISCGSRKKITEYNKSVQKEVRDQWEKKFDSLAKEIEFRNAILDLSIEPVDPKIPNKAKFTKTEIGFEYEGENSKVGYKEEEKDSTATENKTSKIDSSDQGESYSLEENEKTDLDREGNSNDWKWIVWGVVVFASIILIGRWKKWF